jgi:hypothetical protein
MKEYSSTPTNAQTIPVRVMHDSKDDFEVTEAERGRGREGEREGEGERERERRRT